jgi:hypothetical protein
MNSHFEELREARASIPEEVRQTAGALLQLLESTGGVPARVRDAVRVACEGASRRLSEARLTVALVGDAGAGRRTLVNALLGDRVLPTGVVRRGSTVTLVRRAPILEFSACSLDGRSVARLSRKMPDREALFEKSMAQIDLETTAAQALAARLLTTRQRAEALERAIHEPADGERQGQVTRTFERAAGPVTPLPSPRRASLLWHVLWSWILRLFLRGSGRKRLPPEETSDGEARRGAPADQGVTHPAKLEEERAAIAALERELGGVRSVEQIAAHAQRLRLERQKYARERRATFLSQVRDFDGTDIGERIVEYPAKHLPEGLTLMDLPCPSVVGAPVVEPIRSRVVRDVDALVVVADIARPPSGATASLVRELSQVVPVWLVVLTKADGPLQLLAAGGDGDLPSRIERVCREAFNRLKGVLGASVRRAPCIAVAAEATLEARPGSSPLADHFDATARALSDRLDGERPVVLAWREAMRIRMEVGELVRAQAREEDSCRKRLSTLESKRIPDPAAFRGRLLDRVEGAIEKGTDDLLATATGGLHAAIEGLRSEWTERISACTARRDVDACVGVINESAAARIAEALEQTAETVAREVHDVTETLETWAIEEIHTHYRLVRRLGADALAPVASELTSEDLERELLAAQPFEGAMDAFEKQRVGYGLGGAAAGAVLGTLIAPGIGTAVGAVLGVLAGLLKGTDSLKQECIAKIETCLNDAEGHARAQLQGKRADVSRVIRAALDEALEEGLGRLNDAITRLMTVERRTIEREAAKLGELTAARRALEECDERLARLVERASCAPVPANRA